jgi:hypothetical protein
MMLKAFLGNGWYSPNYDNILICEPRPTLNPSTYQPAAFEPGTTCQPATYKHVTMVSHADWSKDPDKCWLAVAVHQPDHSWLACDLVNVPLPSSLFSYLKSFQTQPGCILAGFDFPIGLPAAYASQAGLTDFLTSLPLFVHGVWSQFYDPADNPAQISLRRPFYPARSGHSLHQHLEQGLGIPFRQLYRLCEVGHENRRPACPLFWTIGAQQVGKAAISGWKSLLAPALGDPQLHLHLWPFSGLLGELCRLNNIVVVETYPAEFYNHLGLSFSYPHRRSKRRLADRILFADQLIDWAHGHQLKLAEPILDLIHDGFSDRMEGEDLFDALIGLYGMINVISGNHPFRENHVYL